MTMAAAMQSRTAEAPARSKASRIAHVDIVTDLGEAEAAWRAFEQSGHLFTPYQCFDLLGPWQQLVGAREGARPFAVIARDSVSPAIASTISMIPIISRLMPAKMPSASRVMPG